MSKKDLKITIDEKVLENGKNAIPNLSAFFEECLKHYLGYADGTIAIGNINEITDRGSRKYSKFLRPAGHNRESCRL